MDKFIPWIIVILAAAFGVLLWLHGKRKEDASAGNAATAASSASAAALGLIRGILPSLVTEAQRSIIGGEIKLSWVIDQVYQRLPDAIKTRIRVEQVSAMVEVTLSRMKNLWAENPEILFDEPGGALLENCISAAVKTALAKTEARNVSFPEDLHSDDRYTV